MEIQTQLLIELFDLKTEKLIREIDISHYDLRMINKICPPEDPDDIEYTNSNYVTTEQFSKLKKYITEIADIDGEEYIVNICTYRIN